jgi:perosamine synthetase
MIPVSQPALLGREAEYVQDCLTKNELSSVGSYVQRLEQKFAEFCGVKHAVACSSGTAALHLALLALGVKEGDHVIVPALTYVATANAVRYCNATPVFCDVDPHTWCLDVAAVTDRVSAMNEPDIVGIIPVHLYGVPANMPALNGIAAASAAWVVEDAAQAHGAKLDGKVVGSHGTIGTFSFYGNKILTCGEGGIVTTDDDRLAQRLRLYRGQGVSARGNYYHEVVGYNYRLTNIQAAIALAQLEMYEQYAEARAQVVGWYREMVSYEQQTTLPESCPADWLFTILLPHGVEREMFVSRLKAEGIETRPVFIPLPDLPMYRTERTFPNASDIAKRGLSLPTWVGMTKDDVAYVVERI